MTAFSFIIKVFFVVLYKLASNVMQVDDERMKDLLQCAVMKCEAYDARFTADLKKTFLTKWGCHVILLTFIVFGVLQLSILMESQK